MTAGMIIVRASTSSVSLGEAKVYVMKTVFGFFPAAALANQVGPAR
jgi:hypothetical protein